MSYFRRLFTIGVLLVSTTAMSFALKAEYRFELYNGNATTKNHQNIGLDGTLDGDANISINNGKIQNGLSLSGNGMMSVEHDDDLDLVNNLTISFWVNPKENQRQALITKGEGDSNTSNRKFGSNAEYSLVLWEDGKFKYKHNGVADTFSTTAIPLNQWTHIALVRDNDAKSIKIYINGVIDKTNNYTIDPSSSHSEKLLIGTGDFYSSTMNSFKGELDEIKIYNIALPQNDITTMYNSENNGTHLTGECNNQTTHQAPESINDSNDLPYAGTLNNINILSNDIVHDSDICELNTSTVQFVFIPAGAVLSDNNKTVTVANEGKWHVNNNGSVSFVSLDSFIGNPTPISYTVWDSCGAKSNEATITLTSVHEAPESVNDSADLPYEGTLNNINILSNDIVHDSDRCELNSSSIQFVSIPAGAVLSDNNKTVTVQNEGRWHINSNGLVSFISLASFLGNPTPESYIVGDSCGGKSNKSTITLTRVAYSGTSSTGGDSLDNENFSSGGSSLGSGSFSSGGSSSGNESSSDNNIPALSEDENNTITVGDRVWYDTNRNGIQDSNESGVYNVIVVLFDNNGTVIKRTNTNSSGEYYFDNLSSGNYSLGFTNLPHNYIFTSQNMGDSDAMDSDVDSSGRTNPFTIGNVENNLIYDAGIVLNQDAIESTDNNNINDIVEVNCDCKPYTSTIPSISSIGMIILLFIMGLVGSIFIKKEQFI